MFFRCVQFIILRISDSYKTKFLQFKHSFPIFSISSLIVLFCRFFLNYDIDYKLIKRVSITKNVDTLHELFVCITFFFNLNNSKIIK